MLTRQQAYQHNARLLTWFAPFKSLPLSAAYLAPFFLEHGLGMSQILALQSIFSIVCVLWEVPSGYVGDKLGRARAIKLSVPLAAGAILAYGFCGEFWQFVLCEIALALADGLLSGVDTALLHDSLKATSREDEFVRISQRIDAAGYAGTALAVPVAFLLVRYVGVDATFIGDGILIAIGSVFAFRLAEAPHYSDTPDAEPLHSSALHATWQLLQRREVRWLIVLTCALSTATYLGFWLTAPYYQHIGVPVVLYGAILAVRNAYKAWITHKVVVRQRTETALAAYTATALLTYAAMATGNTWLVWAVLGHDTVQALHTQPVTAALNKHMTPQYRATLNSLVNLAKRLSYAVAGPLAGLLVDHASLAVGFVSIGALCSAIGTIALVRLHALHTFRSRS